MKPVSLVCGIVLPASFVITACGGGGGGGGPAPPRPPTVQSATVALQVLGTSSSAASSSVSATDPQGLPLTYTVSQQPTVGTVSVTASTGAFTYTIPGYVSAASDSFTVTVSNGSASAAAMITVQLGSDPLLPNQWHIQNTGANAFSSTAPAAGNDMNVSGAWAAGYSGRGVKVGIVDSGLEAAHEDLAANVDVGSSFNFISGMNDPSRAAGDVGSDHGTSVAGIVGAVAFNGKGGRGVAYNARLRGYNLLAPNAFTIANMAKAMGSNPISADNDVFNASFGAVASSLPSFSSAFQSISATSLTLRNGLGAAISNAAGNDFTDFESTPGTGQCTYAHTFGVSCGDPANDERRGGYTPIIVGAINADGKHSSYSNTGSALWVSAPGGEFGIDSAITPVTGFKDPVNIVKPAIITTSRTGCANSAYPSSKFPNGVNALDSNGTNVSAKVCQYTATMNGTSAATPNVAGVIALMLEANPKLSVRDLKYVLAKTAKKVDPAFAGVSSATIVPGSTVTLEQGWVTNGAGWSFSNWYGFGAVDAAAAVTMAKSYTGFLPALQASKGYTFQAAPPGTVPARSVTGAAATIPVSESFNSVEFVVVFLNIASTPGLQCNQVELKSPSGTKSILLHAANGFGNTSVVNSRFLTNAFYGEPVNGNWTLTFFDFCPAAVQPAPPAPTQLSTTNPQVLLITGH